MASSNKHWPSMFKSKPCNPHHNHHHQWQHHDINNPSLLSSGCHRTPYSSVPGGCEERTPEPKPRWNPKPEQIRILESIFNSGMVNPPRDEIRKIRTQLQEFGQVGDANVFYWFQNRKSRSKHKQHHRHITQSTATAATAKQQQQPQPPHSAATTTAPSSSSSSSEKSFSPTKSVNQAYFQNQNQNQNQTTSRFLPEEQPFCFPVTTGFGFPAELSSLVNLGPPGGDQTVGSCSGVLLSELMMMNNDHGLLTKMEEEKLMSYSSVITTADHSPIAAASLSSAFPTTAAAAVSVPSTINHILGAGVGESGPVGRARSTVFINDVAFEVAVGPFNVREAFGDDAVLVHPTGHPVLTNEWGLTLQSLQHGGIYYLVRTLTPISTTTPI